MKIVRNVMDRIIPKSTLTFRIADAVEHVRAMLTENTADHVMAGPNPHTVFRGRVDEGRVFLFNRVPVPRSSTATVDVQLTEDGYSTVLVARVNPPRHDVVLLVMTGVAAPVSLLVALKEFAGPGLSVSPGLLDAVAGYVYAGLGVFWTWAAIVQFRKVRREVDSESAEFERRLRVVFEGKINRVDSPVELHDGRAPKIRT